MACVKFNRPKIFRVAKIYLIIFTILTIPSLIWCFYSAINEFVVFVHKHENEKGFSEENFNTEIDFIYTIVFLCMDVMICFFGCVCIIKNNFWLMIIYLFSLLIAYGISLFRNHKKSYFIFLHINFIGSFISVCFYVKFFKYQNRNQKSTSNTEELRSGSGDTQETSPEMTSTLSGSCEQHDAIPNTTINSVSNTSSNSESNAPPNTVTNVPSNSLSNESDLQNQLSNASPNVSPTTRLDIEQLISLFAPREPPPAYTVYPQVLNVQSPESQEIHSHHPMPHHQYQNQHHHVLPHNFPAQTSQTHFQDASHDAHEVHHSHLQAQNSYSQHRQINPHEFPLQTQNRNSLNRRDSCPQFQTRESHPQIRRQNSTQQFRVHEMHSQFHGHEMQSQFITQNSNMQNQGLHSQYKVYDLPSQHLHNVHDHIQSHQPPFYKY